MHLGRGENGVSRAREGLEARWRMGDLGGVGVGVDDGRGAGTGMPGLAVGVSTTAGPGSSPPSSSYAE
jgi:hypothetical protein